VNTLWSGSLVVFLNFIGSRPEHDESTECNRVMPSLTKPTNQGTPPVGLDQYLQLVHKDVQWAVKLVATGKSHNLNLFSALQ